jgi:SNF2 family DNA or RNA helicase
MEQIPVLEREGWEIEIPPDFRHRHFNVEIFEATVSELGENWLSLDLGITVDGKRLSLVPLLSELFSRDDRWLSPARVQKIPDNEPVELRCSSGRIRMPADRLKVVVGTLIDLFDNGKPWETGGKLRLSRYDAFRIEALTDRERWQFSGPDSVREMARKLSALHAPEPLHPPPEFQGTLRPYQREGLGWLQYLRINGLSGILADDMGLGKTAQALAHIALEKKEGRLVRPALVVLPTSLVFNWQLEAQRFTPDLAILSLHGKDRMDRFDHAGKADILLTTYPLLWRDADQLLLLDYHLLILDEAQVVKNAENHAARIVRKIKARHRLCLTGTPLENHLGELWSLFDFLMPGFLGDSKSFARTFRTPIEKQGDSRRRDILARRIRPFVLRRKKEEVARELPPKTLTVQRVGIEGGQRDLYETVRSAMDRKIRREIADKGFARSQIVILDALLKLRQVCCDPRLLKSETARKVKESAKLALLLELLPELLEEGRRILIFSQFTGMLDLILPELNRRSIPFVQLRGETRDRRTPVDLFQEGKVPVFLISLKAGGVGLNLTAADTVIHYDPWWNPAVENQATDRAHRIGQTKPVFVYKLIVAGSIEEKILALQEKKAELAAGILSPDHSGTVKFSTEDLDSLFSPLPEET